MNTQNLSHLTTTTTGYLLVLVLVFGSVFFLITASFFSYVVTQGKVIDQKVELQRALDIAEAGMNYYKWHLAHYPNDATSAVGVHTYIDPEGAAIGEFSLNVASTTYCGEVASIKVSSSGRSYTDPTIERTITARYARPTVAEYAYIINSDVWAGPDRIIIGPYHSSGGIRMDGKNNSTVTSGQQNWTCTSNFGCTSNQTKPGVFTSTANANAALFSFPSTPIDFTGLSTVLVHMQDRAKNGGGINLGKSDNKGYKIHFNSNGTVTVSIVTKTTEYWGYTTKDDWKKETHVIAESVLKGTYPINPACPLIFVQDKVWLEGEVNQKVTIAAADIESTTDDRQIILNNNITYTSSSSGLLAIAENDVLVGLNVPTDMTLNGIFIAQKGRFGRNHYDNSLPSGLTSYIFRNSLTINGTIVSNGREGTQWTSNGNITSGFTKRYTSYDRNLVNSPPPLVPATSETYVVTDWRDSQ